MDMMNEAALPALADEEKAKQREQFDQCVRMGRGAALAVFHEETGKPYLSLAPATRTAHEVGRALAFLISHGLITVADDAAYQRWFSLAYEIPDHLRDDLSAAYARGF